MAGNAVPNMPGYLLDDAAKRDAEYPGTPFNDSDGTGAYNTYLGCNRAASCAPGIGINTGDYSPKTSDWSEDVRDPQNSQHLGGAGLNLGNDAVPVQLVQGTDMTNQPSFVQATGAVAPGGAIIAGVINETGKTIPAGAWAWGSKTIA